jgi:hypothetical protein
VRIARLRSSLKRAGRRNRRLEQKVASLQALVASLQEPLASRPAFDVGVGLESGRRASYIAICSAAAGATSLNSFNQVVGLGSSCSLHQFSSLQRR